MKWKYVRIKPFLEIYTCFWGYYKQVGVSLTD